MRSVRPEGAAGSRLRAFIEEFLSPAGGTNRYTQSEDRQATVGCASYLRFCETFAVAWSLADLAGRASPGLDEVATALSFRQPGAQR
jgi:predicted ATPase with chaperone activity